MKKKKIIIISIIVVILIGTLLFFILNGLNDKTNNKNFNTLWAEKYYETLDSFKDLEDQKDNNTIYDVYFYDIGEKYPIMVMKTNEDYIKK